jgi:hypothetical protein
VPAEWLEPEREPIEVLSFQIAERTAKFRSVSPFRASFGDLVHLEAAGDLGEHSGGLLVFVDGREHAEYVPWREVRRVDLSVRHRGSRRPRRR